MRERERKRKKIRNLSYVCREGKEEREQKILTIREPLDELNREKGLSFDSNNNKNNQSNKPNFLSQSQLYKYIFWLLPVSNK